MKKTYAAAVFAVLLSFGTASQTFAATRDRSSDPGGVTERIVRVIKQIGKLFVPRPNDDAGSIPKP